MVVHFWEVCDPTPTFLCGREPVQGVRNMAPALHVTPQTIRWFIDSGRACLNCVRVARARLRAARSAQEGTP